MAIGFRSLTIVRPGIMGAILPKKLRIGAAPNIAGALIDSVVAGLPGCHLRFAESLL